MFLNDLAHLDATHHFHGNFGTWLMSLWRHAMATLSTWRHNVGRFSALLKDWLIDPYFPWFRQRAHVTSLVQIQCGIDWCILACLLGVHYLGFLCLRYTKVLPIKSHIRCFLVQRKHRPNTMVTWWSYFPMYTDVTEQNSWVEFLHVGSRFINAWSANTGLVLFVSFA